MIMSSFSGGRSSALMTKILIDNTPPNDLVICFANTGKEHNKTLDFVHDFEINFGVQIYWIEYCPINKFKVVNHETASRNGKPYSDLIEKRKYTPNVVTRFCTSELKVRPIKHFIKSLGFKNWSNAVGIRYDEERRYHRLAKNCKKEPYDSIAPLYDMKITKKQVLDFWGSQCFDLQIPEYLGNCDMCFLKSRKKIKHIIRTEPERAKWWSEQEEKVGGTFIKGMPMSKLQYLVASTPTLFDSNIEIDCLCKVD